MNTEQLLNLIEDARGDIEVEFGDFTIGAKDYDNEYIELLATAGYDWIAEGEVLAVARLSSNHADARLVIDPEVS